MTKKVRLPSGDIANFPDDMTNEAIESVIQKQFPPHQETGNKDIFSDIVGSIAQAPVNILKGVASLPSEISESAGQISEEPARAIGNVGAGLLEGLKGGLNIPSNIASVIPLNLWTAFLELFELIHFESPPIVFVCPSIEYASYKTTKYYQEDIKNLQEM